MTINYHDALAKGEIAGAHPGGFFLTKQLFEGRDIGKHSKILDAGCGMGQTSRYLAETFGCSVVSVDKHPQMIKHFRTWLNQNQLPIEILEANIEGPLPFPDSYFDLVISESVITFTNIKKSLGELYRVLKTEGTYLCNEMTAEDHLVQEEELELKEFYQIDQILTESDWIETVKSVGFQNVQVLKARTILEELFEYGEEMLHDNAGAVVYDESIDTILGEHSLLLAKYAEKIGHRVLEAKKGNSVPRGR
ncbi:class I SAM-dependent methyltransferase [Bacillus niameyensis]|uniref:class I SAM-dependent methyltransferase n=1 Tax=Bacillus niameyensis TaxID=1522308 RepID=UPI000786755C|nr:class I SAM-dependent methyltransferase [Bacillus niameyensis]